MDAECNENREGTPTTTVAGSSDAGTNPGTGAVAATIVVRAQRKCEQASGVQHAAPIAQMHRGEEGRRLVADATPCYASPRTNAKTRGNPMQAMAQGELCAPP